MSRTSPQLTRRSSSEGLLKGKARGTPKDLQELDREFREGVISASAANKFLYARMSIDGHIPHSAKMPYLSAYGRLLLYFSLPPNPELARRVADTSREHLLYAKQRLGPVYRQQKNSMAALSDAYRNSL